MEMVVIDRQTFRQKVLLAKGMVYVILDFMISLSFIVLNSKMFSGDMTEPLQTNQMRQVAPRVVRTVLGAQTRRRVLQIHHQTQWALYHLPQLPFSIPYAWLHRCHYPQ